MKKPKIAIVRGKHLNKYEMQLFEPLTSKFSLTGFASLTPFHGTYRFPIVKLFSPMDLPDIPYKMPFLNRLFIDAQYLFGLEDKLKGFDLVHTAETYYHYTKQSLDVKKKGYVKKVIATVLENIPFNNEGIYGRKEFKRRAREELDHIIALTKRTRETLMLEGADPSKISIIGHAIDTGIFKPLKIPKRKLKEFIILFAGRLEKYKGIFELIFAIKKLVTDSELKDFSLRFVFVGDGSERKKMFVLEKELKITKFVIHKQVSYDGMPLVYNEADIFVAPSKADHFWQEQYSTVLLEAQASGLPIVTTCSGGIPENVGDAAIFVQPADFVTLANAIKSLILQPKLRTSLGKKARDRALAVHDVKKVGEKITKLYRQILSS